MLASRVYGLPKTFPGRTFVPGRIILPGKDVAPGRFFGAKSYKVFHLTS